MVLESVSLSLIVWGIVITLAIITFGPLFLRMTRLRKYKLFSASELHFSIRFTRMVSFVFLIAIFVETFNGVLFGVGIIDVRTVDITWYLSKIFFVVAFAALIFVPRHVFSFTKLRERIIRKKEDLKIKRLRPYKTKKAKSNKIKRYIERMI